MIHINLLPEKFRRVEGTPLPRQLTIYVGVALCSGLMAANAVFMFNRLPQAQAQLETVTKQVSTLATKAKEVDAMEAKIKGIEGRTTAIEQLYRERIVWAKLLSDFRNIVNTQSIDPANQEFIWFTGLDIVTEKSAAGMARGGRGGGTEKKPPESFLVLEGYASAPRNNRALEMVHQLLSSMQKYTPEKSRQEEVLQGLLKQERLWDQDVARIRKAGGTLTEAQESYYKGLKDKIQHLKSHRSGQIAKRPFSSFFSDEEKYWQLQETSWVEGGFSGKAKGMESDASTWPVNAMKFKFRIGFMPAADPVQKKRGA